jgi:hypothetical protein
MPFRCSPLLGPAIKDSAKDMPENACPLPTPPPLTAQTGALLDSAVIMLSIDLS